MLTTGIQQTRRLLKNAWFDEERCKLGIERIEGYKKKFNQQANMFIDQPDKSNGCSEGADALRQCAQAKEAELLGDYVYTASRTNENSSTNTYEQQSSYIEAPAPDWRM